MKSISHIIKIAGLAFIIMPSFAEILPEIKERLFISPELNNIEQNAFLGLLAIEAPIDLNPFKEGEKIVLKRASAYNQAIKMQDISLVPDPWYSLSVFDKEKRLNMENYTFPCTATDKDCINKFKPQEKKLKAYIDNNPLFARYKAYIKLPVYNSTGFDDILSIRVVGTYIVLLHTHLREAVYAIENNRVSDGLAILSSELSFLKKILTHNSNLTLPEYMVYNAALNRIFLLINHLLDQPQLADQLNTPQLTKLLDPLSESQQKAFSNVLKNYRDNELRMLYIKRNLPLSEQDLRIPKEQITSLLTSSSAVKLINPDSKFFDTDETMNLLYKELNNYINKSQKVLPTSADDYQHELKPTLNTSLTLQEIIDKSGINNAGGRYYVQHIINHLLNESLVQYDTISYLHLIKIKLKIKQAGITKNDIPKFLNKLGGEAYNPYTKQPILWNSEEQTLSYDWLYINSNTNNSVAFVYLKF